MFGNQLSRLPEFSNLAVGGESYESISRCQNQRNAQRSNTTKAIFTKSKKLRLQTLSVLENTLIVFSNTYRKYTVIHHENKYKIQC